MTSLHDPRHNAPEPFSTRSFAASWPTSTQASPSDAPAARKPEVGSNSRSDSQK
jgi:hypothetical protein